MVSYQVLAIVVSACVLGACVVSVLIVKVAGMVRALRTSHQGHHPSFGDGSAPPALDDTVVRIMSERLSMLEGRLPQLQIMLDGYAAMQMRIAQMEAQLPNVVDAYERYARVIENSDKSKNERERRANKKQDKESGEVSVEDAVAKMGLAGEASAPATSKTATKSNGKPAGVYGRNPT